MNFCVFGGNLTRDPELKHVGANNVAVVNFSVAAKSNRRFKAKDTGEWKNEVGFADCEAWDSAAETIAKYCKKGDYILLVASMRNESWTDNEGKKRSRVRYRVENFEFVSTRRKDKSKPEENTDTEPATANQGESVDIPF